MPPRRVYGKKGAADPVFVYSSIFASSPDKPTEDDVSRATIAATGKRFGVKKPKQTDGEALLIKDPNNTPQIAGGLHRKSTKKSRSRTAKLQDSRPLSRQPSAERESCPVDTEISQAKPTPRSKISRRRTPRPPPPNHTLSEPLDFIDSYAEPLLSLCSDHRRSGTASPFIS